VYIVLLGLPGAGKGTQAQRLKETTGLAHISSGDLFRENMANGTDLGNQAKEYYNSGRLVPDEITIRMILERIKRPDAEKGFMLDGFPRTTEQARALDDALAASGRSIDRALYINVATDELVSRLSGRWTCPNCGAVYHEINHPPAQKGMCDKCGGTLNQREDDRADVVRKRIDIQMGNLEPLLAHYREQGKLSEISGERAADEVTKDLERLVAA
jgi:adenylate kinase